MHNLHHNSTTKTHFNSSNGSSSVEANKSMSLSHPSLSLRQLTTISCDRSPLWTALTTAQVITVDVDYVDDDS